MTAAKFKPLIFSVWGLALSRRDLSKHLPDYTGLLVLTAVGLVLPSAYHIDDFLRRLFLRPEDRGDIYRRNVYSDLHNITSQNASCTRLYGVTSHRS
jgi:hypothetical protein